MLLMWISLQFFPAQSPLSLSRSASQAHSLLSLHASLDSNGLSPISLYVQLGPFDIHFPLKPITNVLATLILKKQACGACHALPLHPSRQALFHAFWPINLTLHHPHLCHGGLGTHATSSSCQIFDCKSLSLWPFLKFHPYFYIH